MPVGWGNHLAWGCPVEFTSFGILCFDMEDTSHVPRPSRSAPFLSDRFRALRTEDGGEPAWSANRNPYCFENEKLRIDLSSIWILAS